MIRREARLELIVGPMFSTKSTELIRRARMYGVAGIPVQLFKSDARYSKSHITSHDKVKIRATHVNSVAELKEKVSPKTQVIGIDEVQFYESSVVEACQEYVNEGRIVLAAGLLKDFRDIYFRFRDGINDMSDLVRTADCLTILTAICTARNSGGNICGQEATRTQRIVNGKVAPYNDETVREGGPKDYQARCRQHYQFYK